MHNDNDILVYSRSNKIWAPGKIMKLNTDNTVTVRYYINNQIYTKDVPLSEGMIRVMPKIIVIFMKSEGNADCLIQKLVAKEICSTNIKLWRSRTSALINHAVQTHAVNIIVVPGHQHDFHFRRSSTQWLKNCADYIIKYEWKVQAKHYKYFKLMLKSTGYLIKLPLPITYRYISCAYVDQMLWHFDDWIKLRINIWTENIEIPDDIINIIKKYCQHCLVHKLSKFEINNEMINPQTKTKFMHRQ